MHNYCWLTKRENKFLLFPFKRILKHFGKIKSNKKVWPVFLAFMDINKTKNYGKERKQGWRINQ